MHHLVESPGRRAMYVPLFSIQKKRLFERPQSFINFPNDLLHSLQVKYTFSQKRKIYRFFFLSQLYRHFNTCIRRVRAIVCKSGASLKCKNIPSSLLKLLLQLLIRDHQGTSDNSSKNWKSLTQFYRLDAK